jgi:hypothetical protein
MAEETLVDALWAQRETRRIMTGWCIAYTADGWICRQPATMVDRQRGGLVCAAHAPAAAEPPYTTEEQTS